MPIIIEAMSSAHNNPVSSAEGGQASAKLAHELSNLLDGSLRNVGLVIRSLSQGDAVTAADPGGEEALLQRLAVARDAMQQMAQLIHRWMRQSRSVDSLYQHTRTLGQSLAHTVALLRPTAEAMGVHLIAEVSADVSHLPAGPLDPVVLNVVRNSLEAIAEMDAAARGHGQIELAARTDGDALVLQMTDTGPGMAPQLLDPDGAFRFGVSTKATGHGLGLALSREIVHSLGGTIALRNGDAGGARVTVRVPVAALINPGEGI